MKYPTCYRTTAIDGLSIFYREAGPKDAPTILLLHGLPSSSRMFEPLFSRLADRYRLVAPDYPGFGHSDWPDPKKFAYTFDRYAEIMTRFTESLGISRYTMYMQDYGGPVGFRMALAHPERVEALIVQDAVAHNEGLGANWKTRRDFWADRATNESALRTNLLSLVTTRTRHVGNDPNVEDYDPDLWTDEFAFLNQPNQADIQSDLFYDYRTNVDSYPKWQAWMRETQPRLLVIWGKHDLSFDPSEPEAYRRDVPSAEVHVLEAGHFALDTAPDEIAALVRQFVAPNEVSTPKLQKVLYTARAHTTGGRDGGASRTDDGRLDITLSIPGGAGTGTNPEQLFAAGWSACFLSAIKLIAGKKKIALPAGVSVDAEVDLGLTHGVHGLAARLKVTMPGVDPKIAEELAESAHHVCPYSLATHGNIPVVTTVVTGAEEEARTVQEVQHA